jgi:predicted  nucleic acid-binding Zn-ribbon protein
MGDQRTTLSLLGRCDSDAEELQRQQKEIPVTIAAAEGRVAAARDAVAGARAELEEAERAHRASEVELQDTEAAREKFQSQTALVKTNNEYSTLLHEIEVASQNISKIEDAILQAMDGIESLGSKLAAVESETRKVEDTADKEIKALREELTGVERQLAACETHREELLSDLEPGAVQQYRRVLASRGTATALIAEGATCARCHRAVPPEMVNRVIAGELLACQACQRILTLPDE